MTRILLALLALYRRWISPALHAISPGGCKFVPSCSEYAQVAIAAHGPLRGCALAVWRLLRCHPFTRGGFDPVPLTRQAAGFAPPTTPASSACSNGNPLPPEPLP